MHQFSLIKWICKICTFHNSEYGGQVWSSHMRFHFPQLQVLTDISNWVKRRPQQGQWHLECGHAPQLLSHAGNVGNMCTSRDFYRGLVELKSEDNLEESLGFNRDLTNLFVKTYKPGYLDDY